MAIDYAQRLQRQRCKICWHADGFNFSVPDDVWAAVVPAGVNVVCLRCFDDLAAEKGIAYQDSLAPELCFAGDAASFTLRIVRRSRGWRQPEPAVSRQCQCEGTSRSGERCNRAAPTGKPFCWAHDPEMAAERDAWRANIKLGMEGARAEREAEIRAEITALATEEPSLKGGS